MQRYNFFCKHNENICKNNENICIMTTKERILQLAKDNGLMKASLLKKIGLRRGFLDTDKMEGAAKARCTSPPSSCPPTWSASTATRPLSARMNACVLN